MQVLSNSKIWVFFAALAVLPSQRALAAPISVNLATLYILRDVRSVNDLGIASGDRFQFGGDINGGSFGTFGDGIFTPFGSPGPTFTTGFLACSPLTIDLNACNLSTPFSTAKTEGTWQVEFKNGADTATFALPPVSTIPATPVPFPSSVTITPDGTTPTISWTLPPSTTLNAFRINIYDKSQHTPTGAIDAIFSQSLAPSATSFTVPASADLKVGGNYAIQFEMIDTRDGGPIPPGSGDADILTRSSSFSDFSPPPPDSPSPIDLPTIDAKGVYHFTVASVGPDSVTFIDPLVATGYIYDTGVGDPNFASVLLPDVGGGHFDLTYLMGDTEFTTALDAGIQYFFPSDGVDAFTVTGIDRSADIDPTNGLSFITGLTFVSDGSFTGTMTPITSAVPEPGPLGLLAFALAALGFSQLRFRPDAFCRGPARSLRA